jgi:mannosyl-3-phosphoglycerate phosphatase family protein
VVATDLDGTLLDETSYSFAPAREALARLGERGAPLVLCSSKTRAELEECARELAYSAPLALIVENGGAVVVPEDARDTPPGARRDGGGWLLALGEPHARLVAELAAVAAETGSAVRGFTSMSLDEIASLTGLPAARARLARQRHYDEPFLLADSATAPVVEAAAARRGLRVTRGGRFLHLTGATTDKGAALRRLLEHWPTPGQRPASVGLGDAANDLPLLQAVDRPILVPRPDGSVSEALAAALPAAERAPRPGPEGWNAAVLAVLSGERLASMESARAPSR